MPDIKLTRAGDEKATRLHIMAIETCLLKARQDIDKEKVKRQLEIEHRIMEEQKVLYWLCEGFERFHRLQAYCPQLLFVKGDIDLSRPLVTIVGTRNPDEYGMEVSKRLAFALAKAKVTVVSGGALGIDTCAHEGALEAQGKTIAILGNGIARPHPAQNKELFERILGSGGALISEYPLLAKPFKWHFPERNRLLSAICDAVIVVQAGEKSGALITAQFAKRLGKPLFAVPADIWFEKSLGCLELLRDGAIPLVHPKDLSVVESLAFLEKANVEWPSPRYRQFGTSNPWAKIGEAQEEAPVDSKVYDALLKRPLAIDELVVSTGLSVPEIQAELFTLEVKGLVRRMPSAKFCALPHDPSKFFGKEDSVDD
jgi:DNA processing protein